MDHATKDEAIGAVVEAMGSVADVDGFMMAIWIVKDGRISLGRRTTWNFPTGDFDAAIGHLKTNCDEEKSRCEMPEFGPLPMADFLPRKKPVSEREAPPNRETREGTQPEFLKIMRSSEEESQPPKGEQ